MNKKEIQQRVSQYGKPLALNKFKWDEKTNTFSSYENDLVLDFNGMINCTFRTGFGCTLNTGSDCTFNTGSNCIFNTGSNCIFNTGSICTFETGEECVVVRRDVYEVIELKENKIIKLNGHNVPGFKIINPVIEETITVGGIKYSKKEVEERLKDLKEIK